MTDWKNPLFQYMKEPGPSISFAGHLHSSSFLVIKHQRLEKARALAHSTKLTALFAKSAYRHKIYSVASEKNTTAINNRCIKFTLCFIENTNTFCLLHQLCEISLSWSHYRLINSFSFTQPICRSTRRFWRVPIRPYKAVLTFNYITDSGATNHVDCSEKHTDIHQTRSRSKSHRLPDHFIYPTVIHLTV